jgi:ATP phosphoribosyltransferase regulatory subunit
MGLLSRALDEAGLSGKLRKMALTAISSKNLHELRELCDSPKLEAMTALCGKPAQVLPQLEKLFSEEPELAELKTLIAALESAGCADCINIDFSVVNDMQYYNGIVFRGFVEGVPEGVLSGGEYDGLMERMNRREKAIGFALYPDLLERLMPPAKAETPKAVLLYSHDSPLEAVAEAVQKLAGQEIAVNAQPDTGKMPVTGGRVYRLEGKEVRCLGNNA